MEEYHSQLVDLVSDHLIKDVAIVVADYICPNPTSSFDVGFYDIKPLFNSVKYRDDAFYGACQSGNLEVAKIFENVLNRRIGAKYGAIGGHAHIIHEYIKFTAGIFCSGLIREVYKSGNNELIRIIHSYIDIASVRGQALQGAGMGNHKDIILSLDTKRKKLYFAFKGACQGGHTELALFLIDEAVSLDPLWMIIAGQFGKLDLIKKLMCRGMPIADAVHPASSNGQHHVIDFLLDYGINARDALEGYCMSPLPDNQQIIQKLIKAGANINACLSVIDVNNLSKTETIRTLIEAGGNPNIVIYRLNILGKYTEKMEPLLDYLSAKGADMSRLHYALDKRAVGKAKV